MRTEAETGETQPQGKEPLLGTLDPNLWPPALCSRPPGLWSWPQQSQEANMAPQRTSWGHPGGARESVGVAEALGDTSGGGFPGSNR